MQLNNPEMALSVALNSDAPDDIRSDACVALAMYLEWLTGGATQDVSWRKKNYANLIPENWFRRSLGHPAQRAIVDSICDVVASGGWHQIGTLVYVVSKASLEDRLHAMMRFSECNYSAWDEDSKIQLVYFIQDIFPGAQGATVLHSCAGVVEKIKKNAGSELRLLCDELLSGVWMSRTSSTHRASWMDFSSREFRVKETEAEEMSMHDESVQFGILLAKLTEQGRAEWIRIPTEQDFLFCFANGEEIIFEVAFEKWPRDDSAREPISAIYAEYRNQMLRWLPGESGMQDLIERFWHAREDQTRYNELKQQAKTHLLDALARAADASE